jgi:hypothetical protein
MAFGRWSDATRPHDADADIQCGAGGRLSWRAGPLVNVMQCRFRYGAGTLQNVARAPLSCGAGASVPRGGRHGHSRALSTSAPGLEPVARTPGAQSPAVIMHTPYALPAGVCQAPGTDPQFAALPSGVVTLIRARIHIEGRRTAWRGRVCHGKPLHVVGRAAPATWSGEMVAGLRQHTPTERLRGWAGPSPGASSMRSRPWLGAGDSSSGRG